MTKQPSTSRSETTALLQLAGILVAPYQAKLDQWQTRVAVLKARRSARRADTKDESAEASKLNGLVIVARGALLAEQRSADAAVAQHSLVRDVDRALKRLSDDLADLT